MKNKELGIIKNKIPSEISLCLDEIKVIRDNYEEFLRLTGYVEFYLINIIENRDCFFIRKTENEIEDIRNCYELGMGYGSGDSYLIRSIIKLEEYIKDIYIEDDEDRRYNG